MVIRVGIIGFSEGNGHPFSFSAIINGYDPSRFAKTGWPGIGRYLQKQPSSAFGVKPLRVTHAWMPDVSMTTLLAEACYIDHVCHHPQEMMEHVDAVIIARDDVGSHYELAAPFLKMGKSVFIDKPLTVDGNELEFFMPYVKNGQLMSCAGYRYAVELEQLKQSMQGIGRVERLEAKCPLDWTKYGIHMLDAFLATFDARPVSIECLSPDEDRYHIQLDDGGELSIHCMGETPEPVFEIAIYGDNQSANVRLSDNFSAFRLLLTDFAKMVHEGAIPVAPEDVQISINTIIAGRIAKQSGQPVIF